MRHILKYLVARVVNWKSKYDHLDFVYFFLDIVASIKGTAWHTDIATGKGVMNKNQKGNI